MVDFFFLRKGSTAFITFSDVGLIYKFLCTSEQSFGCVCPGRSYIELFSKFLLAAYCASGPLIWPKDAKGNKTVSKETTLPWERQTRKQRVMMRCPKCNDGDTERWRNTGCLEVLATFPLRLQRGRELVERGRGFLRLPFWFAKWRACSHPIVLKAAGSHRPCPSRHPPHRISCLTRPASLLKLSRNGPAPSWL